MNYLESRGNSGDICTISFKQSNPVFPPSITLERYGCLVDLVSPHRAQIALLILKIIVNCDSWSRR